MNEQSLPFQLKEKLASLEAAILEKHPRMPTLLHEIHTALRAQPENAILLTEEEEAVILSGLQIQTGVSLAIASTKTKSSPSATARLKNISEDDI